MKEKKAVPNVNGRVIYLLILVILTQTIYPITESNSIVALIGYQLLIAGLVVAGILLASDTTWPKWLLIILAVIWAATGAVFAFNQDAIWAVLATYAVLISFHSVVIGIMLRFIFNERHVTRDVLYAASAVYLLLGAIFVSAFGLLETATFAQTGMHAFSDSLAATDAVVPWQNLVYYSYATLTTLGYGDVLPVTMWARSLVSIEAVVGVLYLTIIMARLVGLYATSDND